MKYDYTIIGAGLGGLTVAALLSNKGKKVHLLEKNDYTGGCLGTFKRKNYTIENSLHAMNGVYSDKSIVSIFNDLDIYNHIEFIKTPELYSVLMGKFSIKLPNGIENIKKTLIGVFSDEAEHIEKYFDFIANINENISKRAFIRQNMSYTIGDYLDSNIKNETLKVILNANVLYYHDDPKHLSLLTHAVAQESYIQGNGYFIKYGSSQLANYLESFILNHGGKVSKNCTLKKISSISNSINEISYEQNGQIGKEAVLNLISNISPFETYKMLDESLYDYSIEEMTCSNSLFSIYLGFSGNLKDIFPENAYSTFIFDNIHAMDDFKTNNNLSIENRDFVFVDYSQVDSGLNENNKSIGVLVGVDYYKNWDKLSSLEYKKKKKDITAKMIERLEKHYPGITKYIEYSEMSTAKTIHKFTNSTQGSVYGFEQTPKQVNRRFKMKSKTIENLFFTGSWTNPGGGYSSVMRSGLQCFELLMKKANQ